MSKLVAAANSDRHRGALVWIEDEAGWRRVLRLGVQPGEPKELPPIPPHPDIPELRAYMEDVAYESLPVGAVGPSYRLRAQARGLRLGMDHGSAPAGSWTVFVDGQPREIASGNSIGLESEPELMVVQSVAAAALGVQAGEGEEDAYPNPFKPGTVIPYFVVSNGEVQIVVYDVLGQQVRTLVQGLHHAGRHTVTWDGTDGAGVEVANGLYLYRIAVEGAAPVTKKVMLLR